jgi:hypothetical protein
MSIQAGTDAADAQQLIGFDPQPVFKEAASELWKKKDISLLKSC